jgi:hypothetical protein
MTCGQQVVQIRPDLVQCRVKTIAVPAAAWGPNVWWWSGGGWKRVGFISDFVP